MMLVIAQLAFGAGAGRVVCLGGIGQSEAASCCDHDHDGWQLPAPVQPHQHPGGDDCPCIDVATPVARAERASGDELMLTTAVLVLLPRLHETTTAAIGRPRPTDPTPGPSPGLRSTRLLL
jgi:hypothetical protein